VNVFVFVVEEAFDSPCLPQDYKDEIEISELIEFFNKCFFIFTAKRELDEFGCFVIKGSTGAGNRSKFEVLRNLPRVLEFMDFGSPIKESRLV